MERTLNTTMTSWLMGVMIGLAAPGALGAATLSDVQGEVLVNRGDGFKKASGPLELAPGDQITVPPGGSAKMSYGSGCNVSVAPGEIHTVKSSSPCSANAGEPGPGGTQAGIGGLTPTTLIAGGLVLGVGAAVIVSTKGGSDKPVSP